MDWWTIVYLKNNNVFTKIKIWHKKLESVPIPYPEYEYLSRIAFLFSLTAPNKQYFKVESAFKLRDHVLNS